jgi:hypothetical protein
MSDHIWHTLRDASALPPGDPHRAELLDQAEQELAAAEHAAEDDEATPPPA